MLKDADDHFLFGISNPEFDNDDNPYLKFIGYVIHGSYDSEYNYFEEYAQIPLEKCSDEKLQKYVGKFL